MIVSKMQSSLTDDLPSLEKMTCFGRVALVAQKTEKGISSVTCSSAKALETDLVANS